jgi:hypothetical protein
MSYTIEDHKHRFAAWAAGSAASVIGCRFKVEIGKKMLEAAGLDQLLAGPESLPVPLEFDRSHKDWREKVIAAAQREGITFTHGVAAKLINIYLKAAFVCGGHHEHERVRSLHPPIDSLLLDELSTRNVGGFKKVWDEARINRWSKFNSNQYEKVIDHIRKSLPNKGLWEIEQYWRGHQ